MSTTTATPINTKKVAGRRDVQYTCLNCLKDDLNKIQQAHDAGTLRTIGNWSPGQILEHCAKTFGYALDGFPPGKPPFLMRFIAKNFLKKKAISGHPPPAGIKLPPAASFFLPKDQVSFEDGMAQMRAALARLDAGEKMTVDSPIFGAMSHDDWVKLQLGHCTLHLSFITLE